MKNFFPNPAALANFNSRRKVVISKIYTVPTAKRKKRRGSGSLRRKLLKILGPDCAICGRWCNIDAEPPTPHALTVDHIIPVSYGGTNKLTNLQVACYRCNHKRDNSLDNLDTYLAKRGTI